MTERKQLKRKSRWLCSSGGPASYMYKTNSTSHHIICRSKAEQCLSSRHVENFITVGIGSGACRAAYRPPWGFQTFCMKKMWSWAQVGPPPESPPPLVGGIHQSFVMKRKINILNKIGRQIRSWLLNILFRINYSLILTWKTNINLIIDKLII